MPEARRLAIRRGLELCQQQLDPLLQRLDRLAADRREPVLATLAGDANRAFGYAERAIRTALASFSSREDSPAFRIQATSAPPSISSCRSATSRGSIFWAGRGARR